MAPSALRCPNSGCDGAFFQPWTFSFFFPRVGPPRAFLRPPRPFLIHSSTKPRFPTPVFSRGSDLPECLHFLARRLLSGPSQNNFAWNRGNYDPGFFLSFFVVFFLLIRFHLGFSSLTRGICKAKWSPGLPPSCGVRGYRFLCVLRFLPLFTLVLPTFPHHWQRMKAEGTEFTPFPVSCPFFGPFLQFFTRSPFRVPRFTSRDIRDLCRH